MSGLMAFLAGIPSVIKGVTGSASWDKALRELAADTPEMQLAARLYARCQATRQRARLSFEEGLFRRLRLLPTAYADEGFRENLPACNTLRVPPEPILKAIEASETEESAA